MTTQSLFALFQQAWITSPSLPYSPCGGCPMLRWTYRHCMVIKSSRKAVFSNDLNIFPLLPLFVTVQCHGFETSLIFHMKGSQTEFSPQFPCVFYIHQTAWPWKAGVCWAGKILGAWEIIEIFSDMDTIHRAILCRSNSRVVVSSD